MIPLPQTSGKTFFVLGYGRSGRASAGALKASGANVLVWDDKGETREKAKEDGFALSSPKQTDWKNVAALVMAPGIPLTHPAPHEAVLAAQKANVPIKCDLDLLFESCPEATFVGITGTNGKSTTTSLIAHILKDADRKIEMGGNIGTPALSLAPLGKDGFYVLELSSYQLDLIRTNPLAVAVLLNITPDHFERHGGLDGYIAAKMKIARKNGKQTLVLGTDEPETQFVFEHLRDCQNLTIHEISAKHSVRRGALIKDRMLSITDEASPLDLKPYERLPGLHNAQNAAAAFLACKALGLTRQEIEKGLASFPGLAHRQQLVAEKNGVRFINDSKATNADAASKALVCYENIYWIAGGLPKIGGLSGLEELMPHVVHAFLIGEASEAFALWCEAKNVPYTECGTLHVATQQAAAMAWNQKKKDSVVLLSPACASWDQFSSFEERGDKFVSLVSSLVEKGNG